MSMNQDELAVKYGGLDALTTELGNQAQKLEQDLGALKSAIAQAATGWEGEAASTFQQVMVEWDRHAQAIHLALMDIGKKVGAAGGDYRGGDLKAAGYFLG